MGLLRLVNMLVIVLLIVGGLNWGLIGLFNYNGVTMLLGEGSTATKVVYDLVGIAALYYAFKMLGQATK